MHSLKRMLLALMYLMLAAAVSVLVTLALPDRVLLPLYKQRFAFFPGAWFAEHLAESRAQAKHTCLIVSFSTARDGLSSKILESLVPGTRFTNAATTGPGITVLEIEANILAHYDLHYSCIIAPINPWGMYYKEDGIPNLMKSEYASQLGFSQLLSVPSDPKVRRQLFPLFFLPLKKHAWQINRLLRYHLYHMHQWLFNDDIPLAAYENFHDELKPADDYNYHDIAIDIEQNRKDLDAMGFFNPSIYGGSFVTGSLDRALALLQRHTDRLIVIYMPDNKTMALPDQWALPAFEHVLSQHSGQLITMDCRDGFLPGQFIDHTHLNSEGRAILSNRVGATLAHIIPLRNFQAGVAGCGLTGSPLMGLYTN